MSVAKTLAKATVLAGLALAQAPAFAANAPLSAETAALCAAAAEQAQAAYRMPPKILTALSIAETGRWHAADRVSLAWPWTVTSGTYARYLANKESAIAEVERLQARGVRNIDVGCMQINLRYHPDAFASLEDAFDPDINARYAAAFFMELHEETRSWTRSIERYHSATVERGRAYRRKVEQLWRTVRLRAAAEHRAKLVALHKERRAANDAKRLAQNESR